MSSNTNNFDVAICYRIYPEVSKDPVIFADDKFKLSEICLRSFRDSLGGIKFKMRVLLDNCPLEYEELFNKYFEKDSIELVRLSGVGNRATFSKQIDYLLDQNFSEYVYFAEDDYFYLPNTFIEMLSFLKTRKDVHFISPFDHLDTYNRCLHDYKVEISYSEKRHWISVASTCLTFLTTKHILKKNEKRFRTYCQGNPDVSIWFSITKTKIFSVLNLFKKVFTSIFECYVLACNWFYTPIQNIFSKKYKLWTPIPSIALHLESKTIAPVVDWKKEFNRYL